MAFQQKVKCYRCDGKGKGAIEMFRNSPWYTPDHTCFLCNGTGRLEYALSLERYEGDFKDVDREKVDVKIDESAMRISCECGDSVYLAEGGVAVVCGCGRVYRFDMPVYVDETHLNDIEFWKKKDKI